MLKSNSRIRSFLRPSAVDFLEHAAGSIERILPHVEISAWRQGQFRQTSSVWDSPGRTAIRVTIGIHAADPTDSRSLVALVQRKGVPATGQLGRRTLDMREFDLCKRIAFGISSVLRDQATSSYLRPIRDAFDETIVADHIKSHHGLQMQIGDVMDAMQKLSQETYENKSINFGCILDPNKRTSGESVIFPHRLLTSKKHKALSDGFRTAYHVTTDGVLCGFVDLDRFEKSPTSGHNYYPEWVSAIAKASRNNRCGICLSRQGDILVFDGGTLRFTYRYGRWQYWNHRHIVTLLKERARAQHVRPAVVGKVVATIYRVALDVSFRRCGGLFVVLRNAMLLSQIVRRGDALGDTERNVADQQLDSILRNRKIQFLPRSVLVDLSSLDGAVVINNNGQILAYGAILDPKKRGRIRGTEGSRTKAAIGASNYGLSVKISSDGDITVYHRGKEFLRV